LPSAAGRSESRKSLTHLIESDMGCFLILNGLERRCGGVRRVVQ
jgi:hypothetical protein